MPLRALPLLLIGLVGAGCDSTADLELNAAFYVGTWDLVAVSDMSGDRSAEALGFVNAFTVQFNTDESFRLDADFIQVVNDAGQPDVVLTGDYQTQPDARVLVLLVDAFAASFQASAESEQAVALTAPEAIVEQLLGALEIDFQGDVTIRLVRR